MRIHGAVGREPAWARARASSWALRIVMGMLIVMGMRMDGPGDQESVSGAPWHRVAAAGPVH